MIEQAPSRLALRLYWLWGVSLAVLVALAIFCWLVVVPVWQVRSVLSSMPVKNYGPLIERLGGNASATKKLYGYILKPDWLAPDKPRSIELMSCLSEGRALLGRVPGDESLSLDVRFAVLEFLATEQNNAMDDCQWREKVLLDACKVPNERVRERAIAMLQKWRTSFAPPLKSVKRFLDKAAGGEGP